VCFAAVQDIACAVFCDLANKCLMVASTASGSDFGKNASVGVSLSCGIGPSPETRRIGTSGSICFICAATMYPGIPGSCEIQHHFLDGLSGE